MTIDPYDLMPGFADLADKLDEGEVSGVSDQDLIAVELDGHDVSFDVRAEQCIRWLRNLDCRRAALVAEMDRLKAKLNAVENRRESVRNYLRSVMVLMGTKRVKTPIATASISAGRERIVVDDTCFANWPTDVFFAAVEIKQTVRKDVLKRDFADRLKDLPGVSVECGEDVLTIR